MEEALRAGRPELFTTDQCAQFPSPSFTAGRKREGVTISRDGKGRARDHLVVERLWRSLMYEDLSLREYGTLAEAQRGLWQ